MKPQLDLIMNNNQRIPFTEIYAKDVIDLGREAPILKNNDVEFAYTDGETEADANFQAFPFVLEFVLEVGSWVFLQTKLQEMYEVLYQRKAYYLHTNLMPGIFYKARVSDLQLTKWNGSIAQIKIEWSVIKGCGESFGTTLKPFTLESEEWQIGQGVLAEDHQYIHTKNHIQIYNGGSFEINPRMHELKITIQTYSQGGFKLTNRTTGEMFKFNDNERLYDTDTVVIDGPKIYKNGIRCGRLTNLGLISLSPGINEIDIDNVSRVKTSWDFRFLYK